MKVTEFNLNRLKDTLVAAFPEHDADLLDNDEEMQYTGATLEERFSSLLEMAVEYTTD